MGDLLQSRIPGIKIISLLFKLIVYSLDYALVYCHLGYAEFKIFTPNVGSLRYSVFAGVVLKTVNSAVLQRSASQPEMKKLLSPDQIQSMIDQAKKALKQPKALINQLEMLLVDLYSAAVSSDQICALFDQMDKNLFYLLCHLVESPQGDPLYGERLIRKNPWLLLNIVNEEGENPIERLIRDPAGPLEDFKQIFSSADFSIKEKSSDLIVNKKMLVESYYQQLAKEIVDPQNPLDFDLIIGDEKLAFEVAKIVAARSGWDVSSDIQRYGIKNTNYLFEIAKIAAAQNGKGVSECIERYGIEDKDHLFEIAKIAAAQNGLGVSEYIKNYGIYNQNHLFEIVKIAAAQSEVGVSWCIQNYGIEDKVHLFEIAKINAAKSGLGIFSYIQNYRIEDKVHLFEIAKIAAAGHYKFDVSAYIQKFGIEDPNHLFEIVKIAAAQDGGLISQNIKNYRIENKDHLFEIAKLAAAQDGWLISQNIKEYGIDNKDHLFEIAKLAAAQDGGGVSEYIKNYRIKNKDHLFEIAKIAAAQSWLGVSICIQNYGIEDKDHLFEIAKIAAAQSWLGVSMYIQKYGIENKDHLFEIAKIAAAQNGSAAFDSIDYSSLTASKAIFCRYLCLLDMLIKNDISPQAREFLEEARQEIQEIKEFKDIEDGIKNLQQSMTKMREEHGEEKVQRIEAFQNAEAKANRLQKIILQFLILYKFTEVFFADKGNAIPKDLEKTFKLVREYRNAALAVSLTRILCEEGSSDPGYVNRYHLLLATNNHLRLPMILLAKWAPNPIQAFLKESDLIQAFRDQFDPIQSLLKSIRDPLKDECTGVLQTWLQTLLVMDQSPLSSNSKCALIIQASQHLKIPGFQFEKALQAKELSQALCKRLYLIQALCAQGQATCLNREFSADMTKELEALFAAKLQEDLFIDLSGIEDLSEKYMKTLDTLRQPLAWKVYEGKIQTLQDRQVQEQFQRFIVSVLENTFRTERYRTDLSPHLKHLQEKYPEILGKWTALQASVPINPSQMEPSKSQSINFPAFFKEKQEGGHFQIVGKDQFPIFTRFLEKNPANQEKAIADLKLKKPEASKEKAPDRKTKLLMELCLIKERSPLPLLKELYKELKNIPNLELANDIKGLIKDLEASSVKSTLEVVDTDDWQDLFLSGTEVGGSCQRVDGGPSLNKCLLAYVMDGKNRMLAVKDGSGKIVARSIFRLLLDGKTQMPLLFQDRIYPFSCSKELVSALNRHAEKRAKELGCALVTKNLDREITSIYPETAVSLGSSCPYEYEDAAEGVMNGGRFTIQRLSQVKLS